MAEGKASDTEIADWCAERDWTLVTSDQDFRSRELRVRAYPRSRGGRDPLHAATCKPPRAARTHRLQLPTLAGSDRRLVAATATVAPAPTTGWPQGRPSLKRMVPARYRREAMSSEQSP
ncbi:MAG: DUF5615 family PIN-like protein [Acidimicrobiales bacterium]